MLALSLIEYIGGIYLEKTTGKIIWGIMSLVIKYILKPFTDGINKKIPSFITYLIFFIFLFDLGASSINR